MGRGMRGICKFVSGTGIVLATCSVALAADLSANLPVKAPVPYVSTAYDWNGWYVGAHAGVIRGASNWSATQPGANAPGLNGSFNLPFNFDFMAGTGSYFLGLQGGYNYVFPSRLMLGVEADVTAPNSDVLVPYSVRGSQTVTSPSIGQVTYGEAVIHYGSARARVGYAFDHFLLYGTGGLAWTYDQVTRTQDRRCFRWRLRNTRAPWTPSCCGDWGGRQAPASRFRSPAAGRQRPNICRPDLAVRA